MSNKSTALNKVADDEEVFALRGRDLAAPQTVCFWICQNIINDECGDEKLRGALESALRMRRHQLRRSAD